MGFIYCLINIFIIVCSILARDDLRILSILGLVQIVYCIITVQKKSPLKFSLGVLFLAVLYLFHSGLALLLLQNYTYSEIASFVPREYYVLAQIFTELSIFMFPIGYSMGKGKNKPFKQLHLSQVSAHPFIVAFLFCVPFYLLATYIKVRTGIAEGYAATYLLESHPLFHYGSLFITSAIPLGIILLVFYRRKTRFSRLIAISIVIVSVYSMTSGHRITALVNLIVLSIVYFNIVSELNKKSIILLVLSAVFFIIFLPMVSTLRTYGNVDQENINKMYNEMKSGEQEGAVYSGLTEFGGTVLSLALPIQNSNSSSFNCGLSYLILPFNLSPKLPLDLVESDWYRTSRVFMYKYSVTKGMSFGGSCLGEAFANFGWFGWLFFLIVGLIVRMADNAIDELKNSGRLSFLTIFMIWQTPNFILWIRSYSYVFVSFTLILLYILWMYSVKEGQKNYYKKRTYLKI